jgi:hypothetical protein
MNALITRKFIKTKKFTDVTYELNFDIKSRRMY